MNTKKQDKNTRYFIDIDLKTGKVIQWDYDQRVGLAQELDEPFHQRVFITKGQYHKLEKKQLEMLKKTT